MPKKNAAAERWGGPGASHEDRTEPPPEKFVPDGPIEDGRRRSRISGGGGERDSHHTHDPEEKGDRGGLDRRS
jgi:hypothetical protein